jgi:serine/threonine protein kinase
MSKPLSPREAMQMHEQATHPDAEMPPAFESQAGSTFDFGSRADHEAAASAQTGESVGRSTHPNPVGAASTANGSAPPKKIANDDDDPWLGETLLGQYRITKLLGQGGFGRSYLAEQKQLSGLSKAVVKFVRKDMAERPDVLKRFYREVATLEKLDNHHLPKLLASGEINGELFLVMQHGGDTTLSAEIKKGPMPAPRALNIIKQVCDGLSEAHDKGVVHRDIKPDNILLANKNGEDWVKVIDVGIAKILETSDIEDPHESLSSVRMVFGTPVYMSPEQCLDSTNVDARADIYSVGCTLFQMLTGKVPFNAKTSREIMTGHLHTEPPTLKSTGVALPKSVEAIVAKALKKKLEERYQSAAEMKEAIDRALATMKPSAPHAAPPRPSAQGTVSVSQADGWMPQTDSSLVPAKSRGRLVIGAVVGLLIMTGLGALAWTSMGGPVKELPPSSSTDRGPAAIESTQAGTPAGMVLFAGGSFSQGRDPSPDENAQPDTPSHPVQVMAFALAKFETRVGDYAQFVTATGAARPTGPTDAETRFANLPVVNVSRADATRYCGWRYKEGGRLPTESEWEWAARSGTTRAYPWGNEYRPECANAVQGDDGHLETVDSRSCGATPEGLVGMIGNAWEWTSSDAAAYPGSQFQAHSGLAVIRGASFFQSKPEELTATWRWFAPPTTNRTIGFRCAWSPGPQP